jgi:hypothetical protein
MRLLLLLLLLPPRVAGTQKNIRWTPQEIG